MRVGHEPRRELLVWQHRAPGARVLEQVGDVLGGERPHVHTVDGRHRRDVARAEALERAHVEVSVVPRRGTHRLVQRVGAAHSEQEMFVHT